MIATWETGMWAAATRGSAALLAAWFFSLLPNVPATVRCWAWRAAYIAVILSFIWTKPLDMAVLRPAPAGPLIAESIAPMSSPSDAYIPAEDAAVQSHLALPAASPSKHLNWPLVAFTAWLLFLVAYLVRLVVGWHRAHQLRQGRPLEIPELPELCNAVRVRLPPVVANSRARSPLLIGLWRPAIILPDPMPAQIQLILAHELAHLRRRDLLWNWLPTIAFALLPWHPLPWIGNRQWRLAVEAAADADALAATAAPAAEYGRFIVAAATIAPISRPRVLALAVAAESKWMLKRRLIAMKNIAHWSRWRLSTAAFILATLGATMAVPWRLVAEQSALAAAPPIVSEPIEVKGNPPTTTTKAVEAQIVKLPAKVVVPTRVLRAPINGTVAKVQATLGQAVKAGKLLVQFDDTDAQTELDKAVAELDLSRSQLERENEARRANSISADDLEQAKAKTAVAEASVRRAQHAVDVTRMTAPFDGIVSQCDAQTGDVETAGQPLVTLLRAGPPMVQFDLPQACVGCVAPGSTLTVILSQRDQSPATFAAKVTAVAPALDPKTGTQQISAQLNADAPGLLSGMFVQVQFSPAKSVSAPAR